MTNDDINYQIEAIRRIREELLSELKEIDNRRVIREAEEAANA